MPLSAALAASINTIAVKLSLKAGREKVLANLKKLGINEVKISCSMALGDQGITLLEHTAGYAQFANGGKPCKALRHRRDPQHPRRNRLFPRPG